MADNTLLTLTKFKVAGRVGFEVLATTGKGTFEIIQDAGTLTLKVADAAIYWSVGQANRVFFGKSWALATDAGGYILRAGDGEILKATELMRDANGILLKMEKTIAGKKEEVLALVVKGAGNRFIRSIDDFKNAIANGDNVFYVGKHTDISPRPTGINGIAESHHGVNSVWMKERYVDYGTGNNAPTVYMLKNPNHNATRGEFNKWAAEVRAKQGTSTIDYTKVTEQDMIDLANRQFNVADVPQSVRDEYFRLWGEYKLTLTLK